MPVWVSQAVQVPQQHLAARPRRRITRQTKAVVGRTALLMVTHVRTVHLRCKWYVQATDRPGQDSSHGCVKAAAASLHPPAVQQERVLLPLTEQNTARTTAQMNVTLETRRTEREALARLHPSARGAEGDTRGRGGASFTGLLALMAAAPPHQGFPLCCFCLAALWGCSSQLLLVGGQDLRPGRRQFPSHSEHQRACLPSPASVFLQWLRQLGPGRGAQKYCAPGGRGAAPAPQGGDSGRAARAQADALVEGWCLEDAPRQPRTRHGHTRLCHSTAQRPVSTAPAPWKGEGASLRPGGMRK